jgi:ribosome-associated translation inhibitor RaiA
MEMECMSTVQIEWGNLGRSEAVEKEIHEKSKKIFMHAPTATTLVVHFQIINSANSAGVSLEKVTMELRLPKHQDIRAEREGENLYKCIRECKVALLKQIESHKQIEHDRAVDKIETEI